MLVLVTCMYMYVFHTLIPVCTRVSQAQLQQPEGGSVTESPVPPTPPLLPEGYTADMRGLEDTDEFNDSLADDHTQPSPVSAPSGQPMRAVDCFVFAIHRKQVSGVGRGLW